MFEVFLLCPAEGTEPCLDDAPQLVEIDSEAVATHITTGSDWCLIVESSDLFAGYDMAKSGRVEVALISGKAPVRGSPRRDGDGSQRRECPDSGRIALEIAPACSWTPMEPASGTG
ncbi:hypothetical protein [Streptomyces sp. NPDC058671]|uniref:hypothetical protein n=1 Tax=Streptomyces sp. NPDC058671 TaxID=3346590 RepID=UPI003655E6D3